MKRFSNKSAAARLAAIVLSVLLLGALVGPAMAQGEVPSTTPEAQVESAEEAEVLVVNGVTVLSTDPDIDESGWIQCRQVGGSQGNCQVRVDKKLGRLGFAPVDWSDPDGAITYLASLRYENKPWKEVISNCTRQMAALWSEGSCWVHPSPTATTPPTETPTPTQTATATNTPQPTATGTQLPTATPLPSNTPEPSPTATIPATPTEVHNPWIGHSLTLGSFCFPEGDNPIGQAPGEPIDTHLKAQVGSYDGRESSWWEADNGSTGWTQTTELHFGEQPRVWSYATSVTTPLVGWYFVDPTTGEIAQVAPNPAEGFHMGGTRDSKWLASLHDCQPSVPTGTPPPTPAGEQDAALRGNGGGRVDPRGIALGLLVFVLGGLTSLIILVVAAMVAARRRDSASQQEE